MPKVVLSKPSNQAPYRAVFNADKTDEVKRVGRWGGSPPKGGRTTTPSFSTQPTIPAQTNNKENSYLQILEQVKNLNKANKANMLDWLALDAMQSKVASKDRDLGMWIVSVYACLQQANAEGCIACPAPLVLKRLISAGKSYAHLEQFMQSTNLAQAKVTQRQAIYHLLAGILLTHAKQLAAGVQIPLTPTLMLNQCANIVAIVNQALPGYAEAGLLPILAHQLSGGSVNS